MDRRAVEVGPGLVVLLLPPADVGPHGRADRLEQRQGSQSRVERTRIEIARRLVQPAVENPVCGGGAVAEAQVHQQEAEIVEHVDACERVVELDAVEQSGAPVLDEDVAEVQIAVAAAHEAHLPPPLQQRNQPAEFPLGRLKHRLQPLGAQMLHPAAQEVCVRTQHIGEAVPSGGFGLERRGRVETGDLASERFGQGPVQ